MGNICFYISSGGIIWTVSGKSLHDSTHHTEQILLGFEGRFCFCFIIFFLLKLTTDTS